MRKWQKFSQQTLAHRFTHFVTAISVARQNECIFNVSTKLTLSSKTQHIAYPDLWKSLIKLGYEKENDRFIAGHFLLSTA